MAVLVIPIVAGAQNQFGQPVQVTNLPIRGHTDNFNQFVPEVLMVNVPGAIPVAQVTTSYETKILCAAVSALDFSSLKEFQIKAVVLAPPQDGLMQVCVFLQRPT